MLTHLSPKIASGDCAPGFTVRLQDKDLQLSRSFATELGVEAPGLVLTSSLYHQAIDQGLGELGNHSLYRR
jgi:3-hydroxyisobutyrate dehydrogenase